MQMQIGFTVYSWYSIERAEQAESEAMKVSGGKGRGKKFAIQRWLTSKKLFFNLASCGIYNEDDIAMHKLQTDCVAYDDNKAECPKEFGRKKILKRHKVSRLIFLLVSSNEISWVFTIGV